MLLIRPIKKSDLRDIEELAGSAEPGLTSLPDDENYLTDKIKDSLLAFDENVHAPEGENYLFVLVDTDKNKIVGTSGIISKVGGFKPFYTYAIKTEHHSDPSLKVSKDIKILELAANHDGPSEICSLYLAKDYRKNFLGRLISLCRFLFMADFPERFEDTVISELRGVSDNQGVSPFWECVGRHFFDTDFSYADILSGLGNKEFIKNLMPRYPIYVNMLPQIVQKVIGEVHPNSAPALHMLLKEGFAYKDEVDIFDAGPTVSVKIKDIRTVKNSKTASIKAFANNMDSPDYIISNRSLDYRACLGKVEQNSDGSVNIQKEIADHLNLSLGKSIRYVTVK